jgi:hypothetical protein
MLHLHWWGMMESQQGGARSLIPPATPAPPPPHAAARRLGPRSIWPMEGARSRACRSGGTPRRACPSSGRGERQQQHPAVGMGSGNASNTAALPSRGGERSPWGAAARGKGDRIRLRWDPRQIFFPLDVNWLAPRPPSGKRTRVQTSCREHYRITNHLLASLPTRHALDILIASMASNDKRDTESNLGLEWRYRDILLLLHPIKKCNSRF